MMWHPRISRYQTNNTPGRRCGLIMRVVQASDGFALVLATGRR